MKRVALLSSLLAVFFSLIVYNNTAIQSLLQSALSQIKSNLSPQEQNLQQQQQQPESMLNPAKAAMTAAATKTLHHAKITPHRSSARGHSDHGWLDTYHSFSFADWHKPDFTQFGSLRVLNEDRVKPNSGFPTHPHRDFEIFSYVLSGELTHRDSMLRKGAEAGADRDLFYRVGRGDVQFTTGGTGISHSEFNEHDRETVHFLQIWAIPWRRGLTPRYHTLNFPDAGKRERFVPILSPLAAGPDATEAEEKEAKPAVAGTIPIHADLAMGAGLIAPGSSFAWTVGSQGTKAGKRKVYVHVAMTKGGAAKVRLDGREDAMLAEGDGAFVDGVSQGDKLVFESIGAEEAEIVVLDTA